jgi:hypothetical protein
MKPTRILHWDTAELASAMKILPEDVVAYFTDGRRVSFLLERHIARHYEGRLANSEKDPYDFVDKKGRKWEVRSITKRGVYFNPSVQVGAGRFFEEVKFRAKIAGIYGFILCDITAFPEIPIFGIKSSQVISWYEAGQIGKSAKAPLNTIRSLIKGL